MQQTFTLLQTRQNTRIFFKDPMLYYFRMVLFVLFWLVWIALFVISILLVVLSPGCVVRSKPNWWQTAIAYNVWVPSFQDSDGDGYGDMQGLLNRLENLRKSGVQVGLLQFFNASMMSNPYLSIYSS
ncbi:unnamed protein product [Strongylus vulgaris]|uniref:Solute carrier family 3 member 2 N-terminal domain-containing protein n=1 Tax=Strongylus vulgaris TaxID=40348 RepID=A0A3P7J192_STRVU|nr:unnamed protein product [Strongylus vulgaris]